MKSNYLETLEKLQKALTVFDMSFSVSNKVFRLAIVTEILDTVCLFEQLYSSWCEHLPFGEGPDADVDFSYWKEYSTWETLLNSAKQNACIDDYPVDMGNGMKSDMMQKNRRKNYLKSFGSVLRHSEFPGKDAASIFVKEINSDKSHMITFGNMVFEALTPLLLILSKIDDLLADPDKSLFSDYFERQKARFNDVCNDCKEHIFQIINEDISNRRKCNKLNALRDELQKSFYDSKFLVTLKNGFNSYDINDYRRENQCTDLSDDSICEMLAFDELVNTDYSPNKEKAGQYIFKNRMFIPLDDIATFFVYLFAMPFICTEIEKLERNDTSLQGKDTTSNLRPIDSSQLSDEHICKAIIAALSVNGKTSAKWVGIYFAWKKDTRLPERFKDYEKFMELMNGQRFIDARTEKLEGKEVKETGLRDYCNIEYLNNTAIENWTQEGWKRVDTIKINWKSVEVAQQAAMEFKKTLDGETAES